ncbi:hypothetical protein C1645_823161 [Glomus cerebriforme]|uniref:Uncharacterized protein n=1 Tax=Glomus cerebriforme TaxID=658196 RepID=A0A397T6H4_9GLOM|nr:hypothetical protein C1645_823161 [Glomus cerebriforme]
MLSLLHEMYKNQFPYIEGITNCWLNDAKDNIEEPMYSNENSNINTIKDDEDTEENIIKERHNNSKMIC